MAEAVPVSPAGGRGLHRGIIQWLVDNFCICEGFSVPRCLMYEIYVETCGQSAQNQVNPATFGKLVRLVFPDLGTRRLGTRGSARYHYDGIYIKKSSFFYSHYCYLLGKKSCHSGNAVAFGKPPDCNSVTQQDTCENHSPIKMDPMGSTVSPFRRCPFWEQELANKYSCKLVEDLITAFWKSLQQDTVMLMSLPDVRQLFGCYDMQLYKGLEDMLLPDFLEDVSIQYLKSVRLFSKRLKLWLLNALEGFPAILQLSKLKEVTGFVKRLRRKTYLSNMAKTMKMVLKNSRRVGLLKSDLRAIISEGTLDISKKVLAGDSGREEELESRTEMKCLGCLISLLETSTDLAELLNCVSSNLQALVFQPSKSKEEFMKLAASFQLKWNFLLTAVSKAMTLSHRDSFGAWHLFHLLLLEYVIHILESCIEEEEEEEDLGSLQDLLSDDQFLAQPDQALFHPLDSLPTSECASRSVESPQVTLKHMSQSCSPMGAVGSMVLQVLGFLVDTATGNKLIQVLLEDKATESAIKLSLPVGQEALITLSNGQRFVIHISDVLQSSENTYCRESSANTPGGLLE
ncbi:DNA-binding protein RFX8 isoform X2 [Meriones unguiculatus]|uniref:DNA-binding protein RFX8 isoform X2 n=1 Tax=Meriones unguiculatus TaxID=10047 RepID=UPI000B4ECECF|nr:DNA-binding protein RFX8 isoform X2 [Meriones unguiculatus]